MSDAKRLKVLEDENSKLKKLLADTRFSFGRLPIDAFGGAGIVLLLRVIFLLATKREGSGNDIRKPKGRVQKKSPGSEVRGHPLDLEGLLLHLRLGITSGTTWNLYGPLPTCISFCGVWLRDETELLPEGSVRVRLRFRVQRDCPPRRRPQAGSRRWAGLVRLPARPRPQAAR